MTAVGQPDKGGTGGSPVPYLEIAWPLLSLNALLPGRYLIRILRPVLYLSQMNPWRRRKQRKAAFVVYRLFGSAYPFLFFTHFAKGCNQCAIGVDLIRLRKFREPREGDAVFIQFKGQA